MTEREALKLALEALTATMSTHGFRDAIDEAHDKAITAIKEALAQPEKPQPDRITTLRQLTENHSVDCLCADCVELDDIEEALAQPEQEPVAIVAEVHMSRYTIEWTNGPLPEATPLYTTPYVATPRPQRTPLTDEIPKGVLLAISNAGLTLLKTQHGYELRKLGPAVAHGIKE